MMGFNSELVHVKYWIHIGIISVLQLLLLQVFDSGIEYLTVRNFLISLPIIAGADIIAHNILGMD